MDQQAAVERQVWTQVGDRVWALARNPTNRNSWVQETEQVCDRSWEQIGEQGTGRVRRQVYMHVQDQAAEDTDGSKSS
jgi:hypothetical protein